MNADFEAELSVFPNPYRRLPSFEILNRRLAERLLWLANPGDGLLVQEPWPEHLQLEARRREVELVSLKRQKPQQTRLFSPWGWTPGAIAAGESTSALVKQTVPIETVARVNSKVWSHKLEQELGIALPGARLAASFEELQNAVAIACPYPQDKWVIKSPFGFAARDRVLGRGPSLDEPQAKWSRRRLALRETLIFQPWLEVVREYGVVMEIQPDGSSQLFGISDLQTNGAGTGTGYILGRPPDPARRNELENIAGIVCDRLFKEGYVGPVGIDALEHSGGFRPLLEINARYTMGFVAVAVERALKPTAPFFWSTK
jgi:hypothetical protein